MCGDVRMGDGVWGSLGGNCVVLCSSVSEELGGSVWVIVCVGGTVSGSGVCGSTLCGSGEGVVVVCRPMWYWYVRGCALRYG